MTGDPLQARRRLGDSAVASRRSRVGLVLFAVIATLFVVMLLCSSVVRSLLVDRQQSRLGEQRQQALWLVESAVQRARHQLVNVAEYDGESWFVTAEELNSSSSGAATIRVTEVPNTPTKLVRVEASYPQQSIHRTTLTHEFIVHEPIRGD